MKQVGDDDTVDEDNQEHKEKTTNDRDWLRNRLLVQRHGHGQLNGLFHAA